ncbi:YcaO-like family protein [Cutibacterium acnes]|uniref:YcaO-like family protein n=1 Tax=Cutibacterium acnes TaxID=1747 RepID=UPI001EE6921E|nr:YcaO-like family protein [Cutibacterium acnes]
MESLERYSSAMWDARSFLLESENNLQERLVSPNQFPRCSTAELDSGHVLRRYDPGVPIRWVRGWSLTSGHQVWVPAIAVYLHLPYLNDSERFIRSVSTGCAVHESMRKAVLNGLLEVVERDAIALTWLHELPLPRIAASEAGEFPPEALASWKSYRDYGIETHLFDATTDFGIPVIFALQISDQDDDIAQLVGAASALEPAEALTKVFREMASIRIALRAFLAQSTSIKIYPDVANVTGGAALMGQRAYRDAFSFLLNSERETSPSRMPNLLELNDDPLREMIIRIRLAGAEVIAVDITTDRARSVGARVVKVLVPEAVPLSFVHRERYLDTPRLISAPNSMGYLVDTAPTFNRNIQPFA